MNQSEATRIPQLIAARRPRPTVEEASIEGVSMLVILGDEVDTVTQYQRNGGAKMPQLSSYAEVAESAAHADELLAKQRASGRKNTTGEGIEWPSNWKLSAAKAAGKIWYTTGEVGVTVESKEITPILEIAHVLFIDIVGYSKLPLNRQTQVIGELKQIVRNTTQYKIADAAGRLVTLPTGDGMALAFFGDALSAVDCSVEIATAVRANASFQVRMGVHSGAVYIVEDINGHKNVAGSGINIAQRIMDSGDGGHILVSQAVAEVLNQLEEWKDKLTFLGEAEVKHDVRLPIYSLVRDAAGSGSIPTKLKLQTDSKSKSGRAALKGDRWNLILITFVQLTLMTAPIAMLVKIANSPEVQREMIHEDELSRWFFAVWVIAPLCFFSVQALIIHALWSNSKFGTWIYSQWAAVLVFIVIDLPCVFAIAFYTTAKVNVMVGFVVFLLITLATFYQVSLIRKISAHAR